MCLNNIYELGSRLCELLSTLKKNREYVPLEILQTQYRIPYESLKKQIGDTATAFVKEITLSKLMINPDVSLEEQISVIQQAITTSGMLKEMSYTLSKLYDVELLHRQALKLRTYLARFYRKIYLIKYHIVSVCFTNIFCFQYFFGFFHSNHFPRFLNPIMIMIMSNSNISLKSVLKFP